MHHATRVHYIAALVFACAMTACSDDNSLPGAPSDLAAGIVLFDRANFTGVSAYIQNDIADLSKYDGPCDHERSDDVTVSSWDDCITSIRVMSR